MTLQRRLDWLPRLLEVIESCRDTPFDWGSHDCGLFAARCIEAMTGVDVAIDVRGQYSTKAGAMRVLHQRGMTSIADFAGSILPEPCPRYLARRGDIILFHAVEGPALGICMGHLAVGPGPKGLTWIPARHWVKAWPV